MVNLRALVSSGSLAIPTKSRQGCLPPGNRKTVTASILITPPSKHKKITGIDVEKPKIPGKCCIQPQTHRPSFAPATPTAANPTQNTLGISGA